MHYSFRPMYIDFILVFGILFIYVLFQGKKKQVVKSELWTEEIKVPTVAFIMENMKQ